MKKERILSTAVFLVSISAGAMANNAIPNQEGAAIAKQLTEKAGPLRPTIFNKTVMK